MKNSHSKKDELISFDDSTDTVIVIDTETALRTDMIPEAKALYLVLCVHKLHNLPIWRSLIQKAAGLKEYKMRKALTNLIELGFVRREYEREGGRITSSRTVFSKTPYSRNVTSIKTTNPHLNTEIRNISSSPPPTPAEKHQPSEHTQSPTKTPIGLHHVRGIQLLDLLSEEQNKWKHTPYSIPPCYITNTPEPLTIPH